MKKRRKKNPVAKQVVKLKPQTHKDRKKEAKKSPPTDKEWDDPWASGGSMCNMGIKS